MIKFSDTAPKITYLPRFDPEDEKNIKALTFEGMSVGGRKTRVFAYMGLPEGNPEEKVPAVVLVHGGGGHAYSTWVSLWNKAGYGAIAMDTTGHMPLKRGAGKKEGDSHMWVHTGHAPDNDHFKTSKNPIKTQWMYHAIHHTILAHNILRSLDRVDNERIGITGISWGGVITALALGYDTRYAFAIPIYGSGFLEESKGLFKDVFSSEMTKKLWRAQDRFDKVKIPVFWFNWNSDMHFSPNITSKSYKATVKNNPLTVLSLKDGMKHSHEDGWSCRESFLFADDITEGTRRIPRFLSPPRGRNIDCPLYILGGIKVEGRLFYLNRPMKYSYKDKWGMENMPFPAEDWKILPLEIKKGRIRHRVDERVSSYYIELAFVIDGYRHVFTSEYVEL